MTGIDPWRHVDADDELVADFLAGTLEVVHELGAWLNPALRIMARGGHISVTAEAPNGEPLIQLPATAFIPISRLTWDDGTRLAFHDHDDVLNDATFELLTLQVALHNACDKLAMLNATHPAIAVDLPADVIEAVRVLKPTFRTEYRTPVSLFWSNRVLRIPPGAGTPPEPMALPLVDLLDHRRGGATGLWTGSAFSVDAQHAGAEPGCFLDYGYGRDALDMAIDYGFVDDTAAPLRVIEANRPVLEAIVNSAGECDSRAAAILAAAARTQLAHREM